MEIGIIQPPGAQMVSPEQVMWRLLELGTITLTDHVTISGLYFSAGKITGDSNITVTDSLSWTGGEISFLSVQSDLKPTLTIANTAKASFNGALRMSRCLINDGEIYWLNGDLVFSYEVYFDNNGAFYDQTEEDSKIGKSTGYLVSSSNNGDYIKQGGGMTTISIYFSNYGEVNIMAGLLALYPAAGLPPPDTGSFLINEGGILNIGWFARTFEGPVQGAGDVNFYARTNFNFGNSYIKGIYNVTGKTGFYEGKVTFEPTCTLLNLGSRLIPSKAAVVFNTGKTVYLDSLNLYGTSTASYIFSKDSLIIKKYAMFSGGNIGLDLGKTVVNESATVLIDGPVALHGQFDNYGTMKWVSGDIELKYDQWARTPEFNNYGLFIDETSGSSRFVKTTNGLVNHYLYNYGSYYKKSLFSTEFVAGNVFVNKESGTLSGIGPMIFISPITNAGTVSPGESVGVLNLKVNYPSEATSSLNIDIGGLEVDTQYDRLEIDGNALLKGTLNIQLLDGYIPDEGDIFDVMKFTARTDTFDVVNGIEISNCRYFDVQYSDTAVRLEVFSIEPPQANRDTISERQDTAVEINVLSNDIDPDGDSLFVVHSGIPVHGTSEISGDSTILYTPEDGFSGMDSLIYIIQKQSGGVLIHPG